MSPTTLTISLSRHHAGGYRVEARAVYAPDDERDYSPSAAVEFNHQLIVANRGSPRVVGEQLSRELFGDPALRQLVHQVLSDGAGQALGLRLAIAADCAELHDYAWEQLLNPFQLLDDGVAPDQADFWFHGELVAFARRRPQLDGRRPSAARRHGLRALLLVADPRNITDFGFCQIDQAAFVRKFRGALGLFSRTKILARDVSGAVDAPSLPALKAALLDHPHVVVIICHGDKNGIVYLEDKAGKTAPTPLAELVGAFRALSSPTPLVLLSACHSAGDEQRTLAPQQVAPALVDSGVGAVLAMRGNAQIADVAALLPTLLGRLADHGRIDLALAEARTTLPAVAEWWRATLFTRGGSGQIWQEVRSHDRLLRALQSWLGAHRPHISAEETADLADRIAACAVFQDEHQRDALLSAIERRGDPQAVVRLLDRLWQEEPTPERTAVERWLEEHSLDLPFAPARLAELRPIFARAAYAGVSVDGLRHCLRLAFDQWGAPPQIGEEQAEPWLEVARLAFAWLELRQRRYQPLLAFCRHLAHLPGLHADVQAELRAWVTTADAELGVAHDEATDPPADSPTEPYEAYLCLVARPTNLLDRLAFELHGLFFPGGPGRDQRRPGDWEAVHLDRSPAPPEGEQDSLESAKHRIIDHLKALVQQIQGRLVERSLMVELFLPDSLWAIASSLLEVEIPAGRFRNGLAATYPLIVRFVERSSLASPGPEMAEVLRQHRQRWIDWKSQPLAVLQACHLVRHAADCEPQQLFDTLVNRPVQCVVGITRPTDPAGVAAALCDSGVPVALWVDPSTLDEPELEAAIEKLLAHPHALPTALHKLRKACWQPQASSRLGRHLIMLWDNPNRCPPPPGPLRGLQ